MNFNKMISNSEKIDLEKRLLNVSVKYKIKYTELYVPLVKLKCLNKDYSWEYLVSCAEKYYKGQNLNDDYKGIIMR